MHSIRIHSVMNRLFSLFNRMGIWHEGDVPTSREIRMKAFYCFYYLLFVTSLLVGSITAENMSESVFLAESFISVAVLFVKLLILIWKQKEILDLLNRVCVFSIRDSENFNFSSKKLGKFMKFVAVFLWATFLILICAIGSTPFIGSGRELIADIAFPLDYKNDDFAFWMAYIFLLSEVSLTVSAISYSALIWYFLFNCSLRYEVLGEEIRSMGRVTEAATKVKLQEKEKHKIFFQDLTASIDANLHLKGLTDEVESFTSNLFFIQFGTSGTCLCGSIYCLVFYVADNYVERLFHAYTLFYNIAELFMITYFGNEIMLSSSHLTYSLYESDWIEQPQSTIKCILIFGEYLKRPRELLIGKLYPLTLETFTRILNSAYSLFNILKNIEQRTAMNCKVQPYLSNHE